MFLLWTWVPLCLMHKCLELQYPRSSFFFPLKSMQCPSPFFSDQFYLKPAFSDSKMLTPDCFLGSFAYNIFSDPFTWVYISWILIQSAGLCLFIEELLSLILRNINEQHLLLLLFHCYAGGFSHPLFICKSRVIHSISCVWGGGWDNLFRLLLSF